MSDNDMPKQPPTTKLAAVVPPVKEIVPQWAAKLADRMMELTTAVTTLGERADRQESKIAFHEIRIEEQNQRAGNTSMRVKQSSDMSLDQAARMADTIVRQDKLEKAVHDIDSRTVAQTAELKSQSIILAQQNAMMGIGKKGLEWLRSKEAKTDMMRVATLISTLYIALKMLGVIK